MANSKYSQKEYNLHASDERVIGADPPMQFANEKIPTIECAYKKGQARARARLAHKLNFSNNFLNRNICTHWNVRHAIHLLHPHRRITINIGGREKTAEIFREPPEVWSAVSVSIFHMYIFRSDVERSLIISAHRAFGYVLCSFSEENQKSKPKI